MWLKSMKYKLFTGWGYVGFGVLGGVFGVVFEL